MCIRDRRGELGPRWLRCLRSAAIEAQDPLAAADFYLAWRARLLGGAKPPPLPPAAKAAVLEVLECGLDVLAMGLDDAAALARAPVPALASDDRSFERELKAAAPAPAPAPPKAAAPAAAPAPAPAAPAVPAVPASGAAVAINAAYARRKGSKQVASRWGPEELARLEALDTSAVAAAPAAAAPAAPAVDVDAAYARRTANTKKMSSRWGASELNRI